MIAEWDGLKELDRQLRTLPGSIQRKYLRQGARRAGSVVIMDARKRLKARLKARRKTTGETGTGNLARSFQQIPSSKWKNKSHNQRQGIIGTRVGFKRSGSHAHLIEFGHRMVTHDGRVVGRVVAFPFLRPAIDANRTKVRSEFRRKLAEGLRKELAK